ncbi:hypothetical protein BDY21DRAFT_125858 [Lineolata rhizophorae]|uniref:Uncharacterized protein n=1 Tax=Lineolata rhizophorae TaxID=578093 RepID=A0A6A6NPY8_9PEZI|nr:hypothetical protein BDY21DRAFT_125858 [Lineolata rhizophorae]
MRHKTPPPSAATTTAALTHDVPASPSAQLRDSLSSHLRARLRRRSPLLHHLNADTSWLLQIPLPAVAARRRTRGARRSGGSVASNAAAGGRGTARAYYNILIDPWLKGGQSDVAWWFSQQWHVEESAVRSVGEVEEVIGRVEAMVGEAAEEDGSEDETHDEGGGRRTRRGRIDAVAVSHEFTDHCHKDTLLEVDGDVPVFATEKAAVLISAWDHFRHVITIPHFTSGTSDWRALSLPPLPSWLSISRVVSASHDALHYHSALLIAFNTRSSPDDPASTDDDDENTPATALVYTPHGLPSSPETLAPLLTASPPLAFLAFLHGLHDVSLPAQQLNLGARNGLAAQRALRARYWIGTHDEVKKGGGLVSWFLRRAKETVGEARRALEVGARMGIGGWKGGGVVDAEAGANGEGEEECVELGNGESLVLEW